jgi:hypothetical protein
MSGFLIEAKNALDGKTYYAHIVPKRQVVRYLLPLTLDPGTKEPRRSQVTIEAVVTSRRGAFAKWNPLLILCYGIGGLEFDAFYELVGEILSASDVPALRAAADSSAIQPTCDRHGLVADKGEFRSFVFFRVPIVILFDRHSTTRGY